MPKAHVLIRGRGIPIHPGDSQLVGVRRGHLHGYDIFCAGLDERRHIKLVEAKRADHLVRPGDFFSVDPDVRAVIDSAKREPHSFPLELRGDVKLLAVPPGDSVGTIFRHFLVGEFGAYRVRHAGNRTQVHAEVGILVHAVLDQDSKYGVRCRSLVPARSIETRCGDRFRAGAHFCGGLDSPSLTQSEIAISARGWRRNHCGGEERYNETTCNKEAAELGKKPDSGSRKKILSLAVQNHHGLPSQRHARCSI